VCGTFVGKPHLPKFYFEGKKAINTDWEVLYYNLAPVPISKKPCPTPEEHVNMRCVCSFVVIDWERRVYLPTLRYLFKL
jgi:hypothetical protein